MSRQIESPIVSKEHSGKWIAWNFERTKILAAARTLSEAKRAAEATGEKRPVLAKVPLAETRFIGARR